MSQNTRTAVKTRPTQKPHCCTPDGAHEWVSVFVGEAQDGNEDARRLLPHAVAHMLRMTVAAS